MSRTWTSDLDLRTEDLDLKPEDLDLDSDLRGRDLDLDLPIWDSTTTLIEELIPSSRMKFLWLLIIRVTVIVHFVTSLNKSSASKHFNRAWESFKIVKNCEYPKCFSRERFDAGVAGVRPRLEKSQSRLDVR
jgi:hypothetical protein